MNKYLSTGVLMCVAPAAFANIGQGFYASVGVGGGMYDVEELTDFTLDYSSLYTKYHLDPQALSEQVNDAFQDTAQYSISPDKSVIAGRAAIGYLWDIFDGETTKIGGVLYTFNATLGLEFGYRLFDDVSSSLIETEEDSVNHPPNPCGVAGSCEIYEEADTTNKLQAFDLLAVARLPFTEDSRLALLLKGGVAYNIYEIETTIDVSSENGVPPPDYNNVYSTDSIKHDEFLPVLGAGIEYMFYENFGLSAEYNAIFASSHHADSQLITGNLVVRF